MDLGRLEKIDLRRIWKSEAQDFTPWLAKEENITLLSDTLGLELEVEAEEKEVGPFRADILCKDVGRESWVLIENQLERTDHIHLGQLITYAAGLQAVDIIWIAARFSEEHRAALDWLNRVTEEDVRFFGLEVEAWRIGESPAAPKFNIISKPNQWSRKTEQAVRNIAEQPITETKLLQLEFWKSFSNAMSDYVKLRTQKPRPQHWMNMAIGCSHAMLEVLINTKENSIGVGVYLKSDNAKDDFASLYEDREEIERATGCKLDWRELPERVASRVVLMRQESPLEDKTQWNVYHSWIRAHLDLLDGAFRARLKELRT